MNTNKNLAIKEIENNAEKVIEISDKIWEYSELSLKEYKSAKLYCDELKKQGFTVEEGICNIPTAFSASFGNGKPIIGILAEYDALSGLSQVGGTTEKQAVVEGESGHGCGHNLLGAGAFAAALGIKNYLENSGVQGTVILYGCPGEEGGAAKSFMAREGLWYNLDAALTWHPSDCNEVATGSTNSCIQVMYTYHGIASHAAGSPERGRSALDAVELMNIGVQFLREHMSPKARIHYAITNGGGVSPNVVQAEASVLYMVRSNKVKEAVELQARVDKIAEGAALMTETTYTRQFIDGLSDTIPNHSLEAVLFKNYEELGVPNYTEAEKEYAEKLASTYNSEGYTAGTGSENFEYASKVKEMQKGALNDFLMPLYTGDAFGAGSTDVGDVSWQCPTAQIYVTAWPNGCPGHSWQNVSSAKSSIGHKSAIHAGKVLCATAIDLFENPELLEKAKQEHKKRTAEGYTCPIPEDAVPTIINL